MRLLAWILGFIALAGTATLIHKWNADHRRVADAEHALAKAKGDVASWGIVAAMDHRRAEQDVENDELRIQGDRMDLQLAELNGGSGAAKARAALFKDQAMHRLHEADLEAEENAQERGPDPRVVTAQTKVIATQLSVDSLAIALHFDTQIAYSLGAIWLAFGFALVLALRSLS